MNFIQLRYSLKFDNNFTIANKISNILLLQSFAFITNFQLNLTLIRYPLFLKLKF